MYYFLQNQSWPSLAGGLGGPQIPHSFGDKGYFFGSYRQNFGEPKKLEKKILIWTPQFQNADEGPEINDLPKIQWYIYITQFLT